MFLTLPEGELVVAHKVKDVQDLKRTIKYNIKNYVLKRMILCLPLFGVVAGDELEPEARDARALAEASTFCKLPPTCQISCLSVKPVVLLKVGFVVQR